jgi:hypothetical protein
MSTFLKVILIIFACVIFLTGACAVVGVSWWSRHKQEYLEAGQKAIVEGKEFGQSADNRGCLSEAIARYKKSPGFGSAISVNLFLKSCLKSSRPAVGFCDGVPRRSEFVKSAQWQLKQCADVDIRDSYCAQIFALVQEYCESEQTEPQETSNQSPG